MDNYLFRFQGTGPVSYILFIVPTVLLAFMTNIYGVFPGRQVGSLFSGRVILQLFFVTFLCTMPFLIFLVLTKANPAIFFVGWAVQLFITTPLSWLVYQQRKDKIQRLRNKSVIQNR